MAFYHPGKHVSLELLDYVERNFKTIYPVMFCSAYEIMTSHDLTTDVECLIFQQEKKTQS